MFVFFFKQKTAYEMRISDWSSDVCSSDLYIAIVRSILAMLDDQYELAVNAAVETDSNDRWELAAFTQSRARAGCTPSFFPDETALEFIPGSRMVERTAANRTEEQTSDIQPLMRISYVFLCLTKKTN